MPGLSLGQLGRSGSAGPWLGLAWARAGPGLGWAGWTWTGQGWPCWGQGGMSWLGHGWACGGLAGVAYPEIYAVLSGNKGLLAAWDWLGDGVSCLDRLGRVLAWAGCAGWAGWAGLGWFGLVCARLGWLSVWKSEHDPIILLSPFPHRTNTYLNLLMIGADWGESEIQQNINENQCNKS